MSTIKRKAFEELRVTTPVGAYGLSPPNRREERRRGLRVLGEVVFVVVLCCAGLAFGAGWQGARQFDLESSAALARRSAVIERSMESVIALPYAAVAELDGVTWHERDEPALSLFRVEFAVEETGRGLAVVGTVYGRHAGIVDRFESWRAAPP